MLKKYLQKETIEDISISKLNMLNSVFFILTFTIMWKQYAYLSTFPRCPVFESLSAIPPFFNTVLFGIVMASALFNLIYNSLKFIAIIIVAFTFLLLLDANNIYPFTLFHFTVFIVLLLVKRCLINSETALNFVRWFIIGIYFSAAIQKINPLFEKEVFSWFIAPLMSKLSAENYQLLSKTYLVIPIWEIVITLFLMFQKTRKIGLVLAVIIHVSILFIFSPLYRNYFGPLIPFNIALIFFNLFLFKAYNQNIVI